MFNFDNPKYELFVKIFKLNFIKITTSYFDGWMKHSIYLNRYIAFKINLKSTIENLKSPQNHFDLKKILYLNLMILKIIK